MFFKVDKIVIGGAVGERARGVTADSGEHIFTSNGMHKWHKKKLLLKSEWLIQVHSERAFSPTISHVEGDLMYDWQQLSGTRNKMGAPSMDGRFFFL